jgi:UDP-N-acetylmuramate--alanine ligase
MKIHFTGIGGAGMAPLAELSLLRGDQVSGSDLSGNAKCTHLTSLGAAVTVGHASENVPDDCQLLVYSSAVAPDNYERQRAAALGIPQLRRGEYLARFAENFSRCVAVTGSHGKSSITAALSSILLKCGKNPGFMIGAAVKGLPACAPGNGDIFVTEADESDGTHTLLKNFLAVVPNVEDDHAWSVGGKAALENNFRTVAANSEHIIYYASEKCDELFAGHRSALRLTQVPENFAGLHGFQAVNAYIACQAAIMLGCDPAAAEQAAADYPEVARRMNLIRERDGVTVIEDYAHHPTEVKCSLELLRQKYPDHHLRVVFQPHRYARLERYFTEFAEVLQLADSCYILPVFAAWSESGKVDGSDLAAACGGAYLEQNWENTAEIVKCELPVPAVIALLGAGDCDRLLEHLK